MQRLELHLAPSLGPHVHVGWLVAPLAASAALHVALYVTLTQAVPIHHDISTPVTMEVYSPPPPPPVEAPKPHPVRAAPKMTPTPPPPTPPHSSAPPPDKPTPPPPVHIGLSLSSTVQGGSFAVPVGNSLAGTPDARAADPNAVAPLPGGPGAVVPSYAVTEAPEVDNEPDVRDYYPDDARKHEVEGQVQLQITIDATGKVTAAKVLRGAGNGFDEAAVRAALEKLHFKPARVSGRAVSTQINYKFTFLLD
jgi:periplasmic protein TonB